MRRGICPCHSLSFCWQTLLWVQLSYMQHTPLPRWEAQGNIDSSNTYTRSHDRFSCHSRYDLKHVCNVHVLRSAECDTDQKLVQRKFNMQVRRKVHFGGAKIPKHFNVVNFMQSQSAKYHQFSDAFNEVTFVGSRNNFKDQILWIDAYILGLYEWKHRDEFDENDATVHQPNSRRLLFPVKYCLWSIFSLSDSSLI